LRHSVKTKSFLLSLPNATSSPLDWVSAFSYKPSRIFCAPLRQAL
jgi:hypothetical protein